MADVSAVCTIRQIVDSLILKTGVSRDDNFFLWSCLALDGYRELRLFHLSEKIFVKCTPDSLNRVTYPTDCIRIIGVYAPVQGRLTTLTREDRLVTTVSGISPSEYQDASDGEGVQINPAFLAGYPVHGGLNSDGYFTADDERRTIFLNNLSRTEVILCYISGGISTTDAYVSVEAVPSIEMYILWKINIYRPSKLWELYEKNYEMEIAKLRVLKEPTLEEIADALLKQNSPLPKR